MTNEECIRVLSAMKDELILSFDQDRKEALQIAIEALKVQDTKTRKICDTCKHDPPSKKFPCVDCDMREPADRWEPQEATHSTESSSTQKGLDTISRADAIYVLYHAYKYNGRSVEAIRNLPSAQPEQLTDKEQRIFLAAMGREEKVCKQVDDACWRKQYEDSLVRTCHEIIRKVKGALWT